MSKGRKIDTGADGKVHFLALSGYDLRSHQPVVRIEVGDQHVNVSPEAARAIAFNFLQCAEAAETDAYLTEFFQDALGMEVEQVAQLLYQIRRKRHARQGEEANSA